MFGDDAIDRRRFVKSTAALLGGTAIAGCSGGGSGGGSNNGDGSSNDGGEPESFDGWMSEVGNYDGVVDETGSDEVAVVVGAEGNGGAFAFKPAAIRISTGTTVVWEWNGEGGTHNVKATEGASFESELTDEEGFTFEHTFEEAGTTKYECTPHASLGMKGVVVVE